ncbi:MAG: TlpA disulfide reductase family protein [Polyangiaceae bacterium]
MEPPAGASALPDSRAPIEFQFDSLDDRPVNAASTRGAPTVIAFGATWDLFSQAQVDFLVKMAKHDGESVHYAFIALQESKDRELVEVYAQKLGVDFPVALADAETIAGGGVFGDVHNVPTVVILDAKGRMVWLHPGIAKASEIRAAMHGI